MVSNRPIQRISLSEKMKEDYYVSNMHYYLSLATSVNDKIQTLNNINASNGIIDPELYSYVLKPISKTDDDIKNLPGVFREIDFITPIKEKNIGEYIELPNNFTVVVDDPDVTLRKNQEVATILKPVIEKAIINIIEGNPEANKNLDLEKEAKKVALEWIDDRATNAENLIRSILNDNSFETLRLIMYNNWWSTEESYAHVYKTDSSVFIEAISPLHGYTISNGYDFVDDHEAFIIKRKLTFDRIQEYYKDDLTDKDQAYIEALLNDGVVNEFGVDETIYENIYGRKMFINDKPTTSNRVTFSADIDGRTVSEIILYYKTEVERKVLYYVNELGEVKVRVIDEEGFVFNEELGHVAVEKEWISECWKQVLLGDEFTGIYLKPKPNDVQIYDSRGHCKLPVIGKKGIISGNYINPIPNRIAPNIALYSIINLQIERQMAKYKGSIEIIPESLLTTSSAGSAKDAMFYKIADGTIIYDDSKIDFNTVAQGYRVVGDDSLSNYLRVLIDFRNSVKAEAWELANMNDSRFGNAAPSSTVTNNQQNIYNAKLGSVLGITMFNNVLIRLYNMILTFAEYVYPDGVSGSTFDEGSVRYFNIDSGQLTANKYGIHMSNSILDYQKLKEYKDFAFAAGQHGEFELASAAIEGSSISSVRTKVNDFIKLKREFEQKLEMEKLNIQKQVSENTLKNDEANRQAKLNEIKLKEDLITDRELRLKGLEVNSNK